MYFSNFSFHIHIFNNNNKLFYSLTLHFLHFFLHYNSIFIEILPHPFLKFNCPLRIFEIFFYQKQHERTTAILSTKIQYYLHMNLLSLFSYLSVTFQMFEKTLYIQIRLAISRRFFSFAFRANAVIIVPNAICTLRANCCC